MFRKKFGGLYIPIVIALERLEGSDRGTPAFIEEKLVKIKAALKEEERLLSIMRSPGRSFSLREWESVTMLESWLPRLPPRPPVKQARRKPKVKESDRDLERSRKRSSSRPPVFGG